jgi:hypothetical protein
MARSAPFEDNHDADITDGRGIGDRRTCDRARCNRAVQRDRRPAVELPVDHRGPSAARLLRCQCRHEEVRQAKRSLFGFSLPRIRLFGGDESNEPEVREIESTLASVQSAGGNRWALTLADNSRWQTTDASSTFFPRNGQDVKIEAGILGSYSAKIGSGRAVKVKRIQ